MDREDLGKLDFFSESEIVAACENGDWQKVSARLMLVLDALRKVADGPIFLNYLWASTGHSPQSYHYAGEAADIVLSGWRRKRNLPIGFPKKWIIAERGERVLVPRPLMDQLMLALKIIDFRGVGIYPHWNRPGIHVDIRTGLRLVWWKNSVGKYKYVHTSEDFYSLYRALGKNFDKYYKEFR